MIEFLETMVGQHDQQVIVIYSVGDFANRFVNCPEMLDKLIMIFVAFVLVGVPEKVHEPVRSGKDKHESTPIVILKQEPVRLDSRFECPLNVF